LEDLFEIFFGIVKGVVFAVHAVKACGNRRHRALIVVNLDTGWKWRSALGRGQFLSEERAESHPERFGEERNILPPPRTNPPSYTVHILLIIHFLIGRMPIEKFVEMQFMTVCSVTRVMW